MKPFAAFLLPALAAGTVRAADPAHPMVVELFQSQGCSSCPPANANLAAIADQPDVLALNFAVTYWDRLGWKDTFASPSFTSRQWDYAHGLGHNNVFTPQMVVNGRRDGVGTSRAQMFALMMTGDRGNGGPGLKVLGGILKISGEPGQTADVWLVRYDPRVVYVPIKRGENGGRTLPHRNIVRQLTRLGQWKGAVEYLTLPPQDDPKLRTAILVQTPSGGPILAALKI